MSPTRLRTDAAAPLARDGGPLLRARGVVVDYGPTRALHGVDLDIAAGELLAITGASGSGKSSLLLALGGVLLPSAGSVELDAVPLGGLTDAERSRLRRTRVGMLFQFGQLVSELPAVENVALPLLLGGLRRAEALERAGAWLDRLGVADVAEVVPPQMSGGQAQRVALARAMVTGPELLLADEPTGALDSVAGDRVMTEIVRSAHDEGTTVVLVTHDARVAAFGDREVHLRDGRIIGDTAGVDPVPTPESRDD